MKKAICLLAFGLAFGTAWCFGAADERRLAEAEAWSAENLEEGAVLFDLGMQRRLSADFAQNLARAQSNTEPYIGRTFQYTGEIVSVQRVQDWRSGDVTHFQIHLRRRGGVAVFARFGLCKADSVFEVNVGDIVTVTGRCRAFLESTWERGLSSVSLDDSAIKRVER